MAHPIKDREKLAKKAGTLYKRKDSTVRTVASDLGLSYGAAHQLIKESGVPLRPRGRGKPKK